MTVDKRALRRAYTASLSGTALEYYDFAAYSVAAATVFGDLFFPSGDDLAGTMAAFSTYAIGYLARPLGGFVFGRLGDVIGRKKVLVHTLLLAGISTFLIGVLPTFSTLGAGAAVLLVLLRFAQGVAVGGEWGGAVLLSSEYGDPRRRGFWASAAQIGPPAGTLLANGVLALLAWLLTDAAFDSWGWRVAFLLSALLVAFGLWIRLRLEETPVFKQIAQSKDRPTAPLSEVTRTELRAVVAGLLVRVCPDVLYSLFTVFVLTYIVKELDMSKAQGSLAIMIGSAVQLGLMPAFGALSDRMNRRRLYLYGTIAAAIWPFVFFPMIAGGSFLVLVIGVVVALVIHAMLYGPQAALITEQFSPRLRYTGSSLAYTLAGVIGGAPAPLILAALLNWTGSWLVLAVYVVLTAVLTMVGLWLARDPVEEVAVTEPRSAEVLT
ncbi:MFS transporter [Actinophytocola sp.]|uniref:MFS transporter n=1 Tax=Actinophytocola sp. TaxID=1872138 RepID=UPI002D2CC6B3|nr:MFS transporter [Actinophytocola sp.]HYQ65604.1 MFS transporter [Actinophytocola sp.]